MNTASLGVREILTAVKRSLFSGQQVVIIDEFAAQVGGFLCGNAPKDACFYFSSPAINEVGSTFVSAMLNDGGCLYANRIIGEERYDIVLEGSSTPGSSSLNGKSIRLPVYSAEDELSQYRNLGWLHIGRLNSITMDCLKIAARSRALVSTAGNIEISAPEGYEELAIEGESVVYKSPLRIYIPSERATAEFKSAFTTQLSQSVKVYSPFKHSCEKVFSASSLLRVGWYEEKDDGIWSKPNTVSTMLVPSEFCGRAELSVRFSAVAWDLKNSTIGVVVNGDYHQVDIDESLEFVLSADIQEGLNAVSFLVQTWSYHGVHDLWVGVAPSYIGLSKLEEGV